MRRDWQSTLDHPTSYASRSHNIFVYIDSSAHPLS